MDIYLSVNNRADILKIPVLPSQFTISKPQSTETFETVSHGELMLIGSPKLKSISISSFFPIRDYPYLRDKSMKGWEYVYKIDKIYIIECITIFATIFTLIAIAIFICLFTNYASKNINKYRSQQDVKEIDAISKNKTSDNTIVYVDTKNIIKDIDTLKASKGGENQFTDAKTIKMQRESFYVCNIKGTYYDIGNKVQYIRANLELGLKREDLHDELMAILKKE